MAPMSIPGVIEPASSLQRTIRTGNAQGYYGSEVLQKVPFASYNFGNLYFHLVRTSLEIVEIARLGQLGYTSVLSACKVSAMSISRRVIDDNLSTQYFHACALAGKPYTSNMRNNVERPRHGTSSLPRVVGLIKVDELAELLLRSDDAFGGHACHNELWTDMAFYHASRGRSGMGNGHDKFSNVLRIRKMQHLSRCFQNLAEVLNCQVQGYHSTYIISFRNWNLSYLFVGHKQWYIFP